MAKTTKTDKFNNMISAFQCDMTLAKDGKHKLRELEKKLEEKDKTLLKDIYLLEELEWLLRNGKAEIHIVEED